jgi:hypothetical protein
MSDTALAATNRSLHAVAEHVLAAARHHAVGRIGLAVVPGGIATPPYGSPSSRVSVIGGDLVVTDGDVERRTALTTLRAAGEFVGLTPGLPPEVYAPTTPCDLDARLTLDPEALAEITAWYELADAALRRFATDVGGDDPSDVTLWPEHFDVAIRAGSVNYGGVAGDSDLPEPYLYVGPDPSRLPDPRAGFWNQAFGASATRTAISSVDDAVEFFHRGRNAAGQL